ncbi:MAG: hypothetical protein HY860_00765 [Chlamydiales bacterium]|nr:hypothetical protein [Chlamydiales bacterium]
MNIHGTTSPTPEEIRAANEVLGEAGDTMPPAPSSETLRALFLDRTQREPGTNSPNPFTDVTMEAHQGTRYALLGRVGKDTTVTVLPDHALSVAEAFDRVAGFFRRIISRF